MKTYAVCLGGFVESGMLNEAMFHYFANEEEANAMIEDLNRKYKTDEQKLAWMDQYEQAGNEINGRVETRLTEFYVKPIDVIDHVL